MRYVVVVVPGLSDAPLGALDGKTPLEVAAIPNLDQLAERGRIGSVQIPMEGVPTGAVVGVPWLLGYDAPRLALRRGPLEAAGLGVPLKARDLALRLNFVSTFRGTMADTRAGHVSDREARVLLQALKRIETSLDVEIYFGSGYRHLLVVRGGAGLEFGTVPPGEMIGQPLRDYYPFGRDAEPFVRFLDTASALLAEHDVNAVRIDLGENPADAIWLWGEGLDREIPTFEALHGLRGGMIAAAPLVRGLAEKAGLTCPVVEGATADPSTALDAKLRAALGLLDSHDLVMVHVAAVNETGRAGDPKSKVAALERIDEELVGPLLGWVEDDLRSRRLLVTSDRFTSADPQTVPLPTVPFTALGAGLEGVRRRTFTEKAAQGADLRFEHPGALLNYFLHGGARAQHS
jgi:2,3-bisphosphoglycerate-independent phosphoglycerate mutase